MAEVFDRRMHSKQGVSYAKDFKEIVRLYSLTLCTSLYIDL